MAFGVFVYQHTGANRRKTNRRLSDLAKVWGAVKFFHPFPAYREIDWDRALIETIPKVNQAKSPEEYAAAIDSMFAALGDGQTQALIEKSATKNDSKTAERKEPLRLENGVLYYDALAAAKMSSQSGQKSTNLHGKFIELFRAGEIDRA